MSRDLEYAHAQVARARQRLAAMLDDLHPSHPKVRDMRECLAGLIADRGRLERLEGSCGCGECDPGDCDCGKAAGRCGVSANAIEPRLIVCAVCSKPLAAHCVTHWVSGPHCPGQCKREGGTTWTQA